MIEIDSPVVLVSFIEIIEWLQQRIALGYDRGQELRRSIKEREFLILGPLKGKVIEIVSKKLMDAQAYKALIV